MSATTRQTLEACMQTSPCYDAESERCDMTTKKNPAAVRLGRLGGQAGTRAQNQARKANAQLAGRPRRVCTHCGEPVIGGHRNVALDQSCGAHGWKWQTQSEKVAADESTTTTKGARR